MEGGAGGGGGPGGVVAVVAVARGREMEGGMGWLRGVRQEKKRVPRKVVVGFFQDLFVRDGEETKVSDESVIEDILVGFHSLRIVQKLLSVTD